MRATPSTVPRPITPVAGTGVGASSVSSRPAPSAGPSEGLLYSIKSDAPMSNTLTSGWAISRLHFPRKARETPRALSFRSSQFAPIAEALAPSPAGGGMQREGTVTNLERLLQRVQVSAPSSTTSAAVSRVPSAAPSRQ